ncbi:MAG TPA: hypothetical protein PKE62_16215 [Anaerolineales bacterium]|nr:hypothetical protein [Anaerolineales bacterium]
MFRKFLIFTLLIFSLVACSPAKPITTAIALTPTYQSTDISISNLTNRTTPTRQPSSIPLPPLTPNPTEIAASITEQAFANLNSIYTGMCESHPSLILKSPDENWLAQDCLFDSLQVIKKDGANTWKVSYKEIFSKSDNFPYNQGNISPVHWTNNSQYLYFSARSCCWDPGLFMLSGTTTLYRMDIKNGMYSLTRSGLFDFSFSPTDRRITFIEELTSPLIVEIQDLTTGSVVKVNLNVDDNHNQASVDAWSSDGLKFAVSTVSGINYSHDVGYLDKFSLIIVDISDLSQRTIVKDLQTNYLRVIEWSEDDILTFQTGYGYFTSEEPKYWQYDLKTATLIPPTSSP